MRTHVRRNRRSYYQKSRNNTRVIFLFGLLIGGFLMFVTWRFDDLQLMALDTVGMAPTPTPFASNYAQRGADLFVAGDLNAAADAYQQAVTQRPDDVGYLYEYGRVLVELGETDEAVVLADRAIAVAPGDVRGYALRATALMWSSPQDAIIAALQGRDIDPNFSPLYAALTIAYTNIARYGEAESNALRAIELDPMNPDAYRNYAWPLIYLGRYGEAVENLETAVMVAPNLTNTYFQLGFEYKSLRINQPRLAIATYLHIIENMNPSAADEAKANLRICETYSTMANADFEEAEIYCRRALAIDPGYGSAYRELGRMQYNRRNYEGAIESFQTCADLQTSGSSAQPGDPDFPNVDLECWGLRGLAHYWMAQCDDAWLTLNQAVQIAAASGLTANDGLLQQINFGIGNVQTNCPAYQNLPTPTPIPTQGPLPTPIGGL